MLVNCLEIVWSILLGSHGGSGGSVLSVSKAGYKFSGAMIITINFVVVSHDSKLSAMERIYPYL